MPAPSATDLIDLVDAEDHVVGAVPRGEVFSRGAGFRVVHVLVFDGHGDVLLQRIGVGRERSSGKWGSSVAGYVRRGEAPGEAAARRMREEVALTTPLTFVGKALMNDEGASKFIYVFSTSAMEAHIVDRKHVEELRFWDISRLTEELEHSPENFSTTLPFVLGVAGITSSTAT